MPRQNKIKLRDSDRRRLSLVIKRYNKKIDELKATRPELDKVFPDKVSFKEVVKNIKTREDFDFKVGEFTNIFDKDQQQIVTNSKGVTKLTHEVTVAREETKLLNKRLARQRRELGISEEAGTMQLAEEQYLQPKKFTFEKSEKEWEKFKANLEKRLFKVDRGKRLKQYFEDYKQSVVQHLGSDGDELIKYLNANVVDFERFFMNSMGDPLLHISYTSDPLPSQEIADKALNKWRGVFG